MSDIETAIPSMVWTDAEGRALLLPATPFVVPVAAVGHTSLHTRPARVLGAHHLTSMCAFVVCAQAACCCSTLRSARPRRGWKLPSIALEQWMPRGASWALQERCNSLRPLHSSCGSGWSVAALAVLEHYVTLVKVGKGGYRCDMGGCGTSAARGAVGDRCRARRDVFLHPHAKT